ncbi:MAG: PorT family protein [Muribaculaceae bacterium]|nr:PorT family protein [Muribaculaceae bacterium]
MINIKHIVVMSVLAVVTAIGMNASILDSVQVDARLGYALGGTIPTHMGNEIRGINSFNPGFNFSVAGEATLPLDHHWSLHSGLRLELGSMDIDSRVKNYDIEVVRGDESLKGIFNGNVRIITTQRRITLPIQAAYTLNDQWRFRGGFFMGWLTNRRFWGWAYDGYLREGTPIGAKIDMGTEPGDRGDFDFDANMRHMQWGLDVGADWQFNHRWGAFAELTYGLNGLFKSDFHAVQTLRPMYGTLGIIYRIK